MGQRTFLHVGPPKTGTTFLQAGWRDQSERLTTAGLLFPGQHDADQFRACVLAIEHPVFAPRLQGAKARTWERFREQIAAHPGDALLSSEFYARADLETAKRVVDDLHEVSGEVHVVITARDLGRQVLASWQQAVKRGSTSTLQNFWDKHHAGGEFRWTFWRNQDLPALAQRWLDAGADAVTLVVVGAPGASHDQVWHDLCSVLDVPAEPVPRPKRSNQSLGAVEIEVLRRMNASLSADRDRVRTANLTSKFYSEHLASLARPRVPVAVSASLVEQVHERAADQLERLSAMVDARSLTVVGDLAALVPRIEPVDSTLTEAQVADVSTRLLAELTQRQLDTNDREKQGRAEIRELRGEIHELHREMRIGPSLRRVVRRLTRQAR